MKKVLFITLIFIVVFLLTGCTVRKLKEIENAFSAERESLLATIEASESEVQRLTTEQSSLQTKYDKSTEALNTLTADHTSLQTQFDETSSALTAANEQLTALSGENGTLKQAITEAITQIAQITASSVQEAEAIPPSSDESADDGTNIVNDLNSSLAALNRTVSDKDTALSEAASEILRLTGENETLTKSVEELTGQLTTARNDITTLTGENETLTQSVEELTGQLAAAQNDITTLTGEKETLQAQLAAIQDLPENIETDESPENPIAEETGTDNDSGQEIPAADHTDSSPENNEESAVGSAEQSAETAELAEDTVSEPQAVQSYTEQVSGMELVYVPAGSFLFGTESSSPDEASLTEIYLDSFWIGKTEVTNAQYKKCVDAGICTATDLMDLGSGQFADFPVTYVPYRQAQRFCSWIGGSLPDEYQWEKAARGNDGRIYPWGNEEPDLINQRANIPGLIGDLSAVGQFPEGVSPCGAMDMGGNVWEWTGSRYRSDIDRFLQEQTAGGSILTNPLSPDDGEEWVVRGGSCAPTEKNNYINFLRSTYRDHSDNEKYYLGFRCVLQEIPE